MLLFYDKKMMHDDIEAVSPGLRRLCTLVRVGATVGLVMKRIVGESWTSLLKPPDGADELGDLTEIDLGGLIPTGEYEQFRRKATAYLREHRGEAAIAKIHRGEPVTAADLEELRRILVDSGIATAADLERADTEAGGFGIFVRSLVGLDRGAAKAAFADFLDGSTYTAAQIDFVNLLIDALTHDGIVEPARFYESPFTDMSPSGPESLFTDPDLDALLEVLDRLRRHAAA